jgi:hypothetical protein
MVGNMAYTLSEAAAATGHNRSAIFKAIRKGALSARRDEATGHWLVEAAELHRLYPPVMPAGAKGPTGNGQEMAGNGELREVRARLADALSQVDDLKRRLDESERERRATAEKLTALLSDSRTAPAATPASPSPARRSWWPWQRRG